MKVSLYIGGLGFLSLGIGGLYGSNWGEIALGIGVILLAIGLAFAEGGEKEKEKGRKCQSLESERKTQNSHLSSLIKEMEDPQG